MSYEPSPIEITEACQRIRATWSTADSSRRRDLRNVQDRDKRPVSDAWECPVIPCESFRHELANETWWEM